MEKVGVDMTKFGETCTIPKLTTCTYHSKLRIVERLAPDEEFKNFAWSFRYSFNDMLYMLVTGGLDTSSAPYLNECTYVFGHHIKKRHIRRRKKW